AFVLVRRRWWGGWGPLACLPCALIRLLCLAHDSPVLGDLRCVVRDANLIVKELAANVANEPHELARVLEQPALAAELADAISHSAQERLEISRPPFVVRLFLLRHATA